MNSYSEDKAFFTQFQPQCRCKYAVFTNRILLSEAKAVFERRTKVLYSSNKDVKLDLNAIHYMWDKLPFEQKLSYYVEVVYN